MSESLSLTQEEAQQRAALVAVERYHVVFDLTGLLEGDELRTVSTITFSCAEPGAQTFLECLGEVAEASLNGQPLPAGPPPDGRLTLPDLQTANVVVVSSVQRETGAGRGVHRAVDPGDQQVYVWSSFEPDDARVAFACFDQPDLKAPFAIEVTAPADWTVLSNSDVAEVIATDGGRHWRFADTPPLSTYVVVFNAGQYAEMRSTRGGYDLGLYARRTLTDCLARDADELFELTAQGLEFYGRRFQFPFPQTRYDQVFAPEMGGAMENYGCVTFSDAFVFREQPSYAERELRAVVLLHEMAHMWFGDVVTMRWWDDLWLNESFAEWACAWSATAATEFTDVWAGVLAGNKQRGYTEDQAPTTHPIRRPVSDTAAAAASFDAITYPKGAAVLKQLVAYVGEESFVAGLVSYFHRYAWQNTTLADLVAELEQASGRDLSDWVHGWLETAGVDRLTLERSEGRLQLRALAPAGRAPLPHRLNVGCYQVPDQSDEALVLTDTVNVRVEGELTDLGPEDPGLLILLNDDDLTYALARPDEHSLQLLLRSGARLPTAVGRTLAVTTAWDLVFNGELTAREFLDCVAGVLPRESAASVVEPLLDLAVGIADYWSPESQRAELLGRMADLSLELADDPAGRLAAVRALARTATTDAQLEELGRHAYTADLKWRRLTRLAEFDVLDQAEVRRLLIDDPNPDAWANAEVARSAQPSEAAKQRAWELTYEQHKVPVESMGAIGTAFWRRGQGDVLAPYVTAYVAGLRGLHTSGMQWTLAIVGPMFPRAVEDEADVDRLAAAASGPGVSPLVNARARARLDTLQRMRRTRGLP